MTETEEDDLKVLCVLPKAWGYADSKTEALDQALTYWHEYGMDEDQITLRFYEVEPESLQVTMYGEVHSQTVNDLEHTEIDPEDLKAYSDLRQDFELLQKTVALDGELEVYHPKSDIDRIL